MLSLEDFHYLVEFSMDPSGNEAKLNIGAILTLLLIGGAFIYISITIALNDRMANDLAKEKLKSELLLSEKLSEQKKNVHLAKQIKRMDAKYKLASINLKSALEKLSQMEGDLDKARTESNKKTIQRQKEEIETLLKKINRDSVDNGIALNQVKAYSSALESKVSDKTSEIQQYIHEIERLRRLNIGDVKTETLKKNNRLTFKATKTKTIRVNLKIAGHADNLTFQINDPSGKKMSIDGKNSSLVVHDYPNQSTSQAFIISPEIQLKSIEKFKIIEIVYLSPNKLTPGTYKITILSPQDILGSCLIRLE